MSSIFQTKEELLGTENGKEFLESILGKLDNLANFTIKQDVEYK